jgi:putative ABC transport system permease protein
MTAAASSAGRERRAKPLPGRAPLTVRWRAMATAGWKMMFHDRLKLVGTLIGVVFAVVLSNQQAGTFLGLLEKNIMFVKNADCDIWITPRSTQTLQPGSPIADAALYQARVVDGVDWAEPILFGGASVQLPNGGSEPITLVGVKLPRQAGGPWNLVAGDKESLSRPDTMVFEDSEREKLGGLNLGSIREVNGHKVQAVAFTWGLLPFGPSYAFTEFDTARSLLHVDRDRVHFVLVKLRPGVDPAPVVAELQRRLPEAKVLRKQEFQRSIVNYLLFSTAIGITFGTSAIFGLIVGFVIVALSMFSAVVDNIREFGTLKAIGATTSDLAKLLFVQSVTYAVIGSLIGLAAVSGIAGKIRSPQLGLVLLPQMYGGTVVLMIILCVVASSLALLRLRRLEPAMVFR